MDLFLSLRKGLCSFITYRQTETLTVCPFFSIGDHMNSVKMQKEIFEDIEGHEGIYQVSNIGKVKSLGRFDSHNHFLKELIFKQHINECGYCIVGLCKNGLVKQKRVHRLVGSAFVPNHENKPCINHKDGNKLNNYYLNLEWCTYSENHKHAYRVLGRKPHWLSKFGENSANGIPVYQYSKENKFIAKFGSALEAERKTKIQASNIASVCKNKRKYAGEFIWRLGLKISLVIGSLILLVL